jgi:diguanylate cyclase (GGDEF)-like protein/PAS domain S-box-containing protein
MKPKILIVEDEIIVALDLKQRLENAGYAVVGQASSGQEALELVRKGLPDLILMDIKIKGPWDGIETSERIRTFFDVPIIFLTAFADDATLKRAKVTGPSGYILKPFQERELFIALDMALYKHKMEKNLRESEERYMLALRGANDGIWDWNLKKNQIFFSRRWKDMVGCQEDEIGYRIEDWLRLIHPEDRDVFQSAITHHIEGLTGLLECEQRMLHKDGRYRWFRTRGMAVSNGSGRAHRLAGSISDITALKHAQEQLAHDAYHDGLTGLPNRSLFLDRLDHAMERRKRATEQTLSVLFMDVDQFKVVNDSLGHQAGDLLLIEIAARLKKYIRSSDTVARFGGDEFVVLLESAVNAAYACNVAERISEILREPFQIEERIINTSISIGIVMVTPDYANPNEVLRDADIAMYRAKSLGKARYEVFDVHLRQRATERMEIINRMRTAIEQGEFYLHYQPICSLDDRKVVGLEALLRLTRNDGSPIKPAEFIPIAEEVGLINQIGDWVLMESCRKMSEWHRLNPKDAHLDLHINVSIKQLVVPNFVDRLKEILKITGMDPNRLMLEITETVFAENIEKIALVLEQIRLLKVRLVIDDFGTGYSSLGYIRRFPIDMVKLDSSFIGPLVKNDKNSGIIRAVLLIANKFGLKVVAEGIETEFQYDYLNEMKCHFGQGFLFSRPLDSEKVEQIFNQVKV